MEIKKVHEIFFIIILFGFFLTLIPLVHSNDECRESLSVYIQFKALDGIDNHKIGKYQSPDYKEDDLLSLWKILIYNEGSCKSVKSEIKLNLTNEEEYFDHFFCKYQIEIPEIDPGESYSFSRNGWNSVDLDNGQIVELPLYKDSKGNNLTSFCFIRLSTTGPWEGKLSLEPKDPKQQIEGWSSTMILDNGDAGRINFKVRPKQEVLALEQQKASIKLSWVVIILGIATIFFMWGLPSLRDRGKQIGLLDSLKVELDTISNGDKKNEGNLEWFLNSIDEGDPLHSVWNINPLPYMAYLSHSAIGKNKKINSLKKDMVKLHQKIEMINGIVLSGKYRLRKQIQGEKESPDTEMSKFVKKTIKESINRCKKMKRIIKEIKEEIVWFRFIKKLKKK